MTPSWKLREVKTGDVGAVFELRNDPFIVERSTTRKAISWPEHQAWFENSLNRDDQLAFLIDVEDEGKPVGVIRFEKETDEDAVISVYVLERHTRHGLGVDVIRAGCHMVFERWRIAKVLAYVRADNIAGQKAFEKVGFCRQESARSSHEKLNPHLLFCLNGNTAV